MDLVLRFFALLMAAGGLFMGYKAGTAFESFTDKFQWELAIGWWAAGLAGGALFFALEVILDRLEQIKKLQLDNQSRIEKVETNVSGIEA